MLSLTRVGSHSITSVTPVDGEARTRYLPHLALAERIPARHDLGNEGIEEIDHRRPSRPSSNDQHFRRAKRGKSLSLASWKRTTTEL